jgi:hypothetical protein
MKSTLALLAILLGLPCDSIVHAQVSNDMGVTWLAHYDGKSLPAAPWTTIGKPNAKLEDGALGPLALLAVT